MRGARTTRSAHFGLSAYSLGLGDPGFECGSQRVAHGLELDPVEHVLEEATHDQALSLGAREAAGHQVEELLAIDLAERRAVRGFFQDVLDRIELEPVREALGAALEARIPQA